jgi:multimeric flavodoxin WrbA
METGKKITAIVGTYRKGGIIDQAVNEVLAAAKEAGAGVTKIYLVDRNIEFCRNCRACTQQQDIRRGECVIGDEMCAVLDDIEKSDAIVIASPVNFGTVSAVMKKFIERLVCFAYWPWGKAAPKIRDQRKSRKAVVISASAAPAILTRLFTKTIKQLKTAAGLLGAETTGVLVIGMAALSPQQEISEGAKRKAHRLGTQLAQ